MHRARIAFVNTGRYTSSRGITAFSDPIHLVAMHNICKQGGYESRIFQLGVPDYPGSIEAIHRFAPTILALSFLAPFKNDIEMVEALVQGFDRSTTRLLLGGPDVELDPGFYVSAFEASVWRSSLLAQGPGESLIEALVQHDFAIEAPEAQQALRALGARCEANDGHWQISGLRETPLDEQEYTRDYDLAPFQHKAGVKWSTGCWAACAFCPNIPGRSSYRAPETIAEEVRYLMSLGAQKLDIASPQFTAHPARSSAIIDALPDETPPLFFSSRVDSLYHAITRFPDAWRRFANNNQHGIGLGVDSFLPEKLVRLRKYPSVAQAEKQAEKLDAVLSFFADTRLNVVFYMITFDWAMDLDEATTELETLLHLLNAYSSTIQIAPENVTNVLSANKGTQFSSHRKPIEFLRFERDPRLFLMLYSMYATHERLEELIGLSDESPALMEAAASRLLVKYGLRLLDALRDIPAEAVSCEGSFAVLSEALGSIFQEGQDNPETRGAFCSRQIQEQLLEVYPPKPQKKLRKHFAKEDKKMGKRLDQEYDILLTRKALHRMYLEGKIDEKTMTKQLRKHM